jgi:hypothetical protein
MTDLEQAFPQNDLKFGTLFSRYNGGSAKRAALLHRDAFGEIARLINIAAARYGDMIGQQL